MENQDIIIENGHVAAAPQRRRFNPVEVELDEPVEWEGKTHTHVRVKLPTVRQMRELVLLRRGIGRGEEVDELVQFDSAAKMIAILTGLPSEMLDLLAFVDFQRVSEVAKDFTEAGTA